MVPLEGMSYGEIRNYATLYDPRVIQISLESLYTRFSHLKLNHFYPLIHTKSEIILKAEPERYDVSELPLIIRERDPEYQFHRVILFRRLLHVSFSTRIGKLYYFTKHLLLVISCMDFFVTIIVRNSIACRKNVSTISN